MKPYKEASNALPNPLLTLNPEPLNPKPLNPKPSTLTPKPFQYGACMVRRGLRTTFFWVGAGVAFRGLGLGFRAHRFIGLGFRATLNPKPVWISWCSSGLRL